MISYLNGIILDKNEDSLVVDVGGVGYDVWVGKATALQLGSVGEAIQIYIHTNMNDSQLRLYGFLTKNEKQLFQKLIAVSGVGPKLGVALVSSLPFEALVAALMQGDLATLTSVSGVGKKTAERLVIELKDKLKTLALPKRADIIRKTIRPIHEGPEHEAVQALVSLGYSSSAAERALQSIEISKEDNTQSLIKKSLGVLAS